MSEIITPPEKLTARQLKAISALLSCQTIGDAAILTGVTARTMTRWLDQAPFQDELARAGRATIDAISRRLVAGHGKALDTLYTLMDASGLRNENTRRLAAVSWLTILGAVREAGDLEARLQRIEQELKI